MQLVADGLSNRQIGERLSISVATVKWYLQRIFTMLDVKRRTQAVAVARAAGLLYEKSSTSDVQVALPIPQIPLVGREKEITLILDQLSQPDVRFLTIFGPGGIGKSRLALSVARKWAERSQPVALIQLEGIQSVEHLIPAVAQAVGFQFHGRNDPRIQLLEYLDNSPLLLVLDSCENLLEGVPLFARMLEMCHDLKFLATSRERLGLQGEIVLSLKGLACTQGSTSDAVKLFIQSARRIDVRFEPVGEDSQHIAHICQTVDGIPLAIELAAGWIDQLSPAQIAHEVNEGHTVLKRALSNPSSRHSSMETVFTQSWNLLSDIERTVLKKLSVFNGHFGWEAAEHVAKATPINLKSLVNKSRIQPLGKGRYHIHELLRQFSLRKLALDDDEHQETLLKYARYYLNLLHHKQCDLEEEKDPRVIQELREDMDNIWAAWRIGGKNNLAYEIAQATRTFTILHTSCGLIPNLVQEIEYVLPYLRTQLHLPDANLAVARILIMLSPAYAQYLPERALELVDEAAVHLDYLDRPFAVDITVFHTFSGIILMALENYEEALEELSAAVKYCQHDSNDAIVWYAPLCLTLALIELDQYQAAQDTLEHVKNGLQSFDAFYCRSHMLPALALVSAGRNQFHDSRQYLLEAIEEYRKYPQILPLELFLIALAEYLSRTGFFEKALEIVNMYFEPVLLQLFLAGKAKRLRDMLEQPLSLDKRQSIRERAKDWLAVSPSPTNPVGMSPGFLDYVTGLVWLPKDGNQDADVPE